MTINNQDQGKLKENNSSPSVSLWPLFLIRAFLAMTISSMMVNLPHLADIIWGPGDFIEYSVEMGAVMASRTWTAAISGILFGSLADKFSRKKFLVAVSILMGITYIMIGFLPYQVGRPSYYYFLFCQIGAGFSLGGFFPLLHSYSNDSIEKEQRSRFFGKIAAVGQVAMIIGLVISSIVISSSYWRFWFWGIGTCVFIGGILLIFFIKEPDRAGLHGFEDETLTYDYKINKKTFKDTIISPTNIVAFFEGLFTRTATAMTVFLIVPYFQEEHMLSAFFTGLMMIIFGLPGAITGNILFGKVSDRWGEKDIKNRVKLIIFSIFFVVTFFALIFYVPMPVFGASTTSGNLGWNDITLLGQYPAIWIIGVLLFCQRFVRGIYDINQPPILQAINLPEAQGKVLAWNQFLETVGNGIGPILGGYLLTTTNGNYVEVALICILIALPGGVFWAYALPHIKQDVSRVNMIIEERYTEKYTEKNTETQTEIQKKKI